MPVKKGQKLSSSEKKRHSASKVISVSHAESLNQLTSVTALPVIEEYDFVIIGGGAAGFSAATKASELGIKTVLINDGLPIGGTCINVGCVPSKILIEMGNRYYYSRNPGYDALEGKCVCTTPIDFKEAVKEKNKMIETLRNKNYIQVLQSFKHVKYIKGHARFISPHEVMVNDTIIKGRKFLIATGSRPRIIPIAGMNKMRILTNKEALNLDYLPKTLIVIGAGPIGLELSQMFHHFGSKVIVLEKAPQILPRMEPEIAFELHHHLSKEGITIHVNVDILALDEQDGKKIVHAKHANKKVTFEGTDILMAVGVTPNTENLGLKAAGVHVDQRGFIITDTTMQTSAPHVWAAGDVTGKSFLETTAAKEGYMATSNAFELTHKSLDYDSVPQAVFTMPQVASVGLTETEFKKRFEGCRCRTIYLDQVPKALAIKDTRGLVKMIVHPDTDVILGVHIVAPNASELIHEATLAVKFKLTIDDLIDTVHVFPTISEGIKRAAQAFRRNVATMTCCVE